jgi:serine acetyltransferase
MSNSAIKSLLVAPLRTFLRATAALRQSARRLFFHASLAEQLSFDLPTSAVVLGRGWVFGTGAVRFGEDALLYPDLHLETQGSANIEIGDGVVLSRGVHLVAMAGITIGRGTMIGEYSSVRDANHQRLDGVLLRDAGFDAMPIVLGSEVWVGRGVAILGGITIGDGATIGANAVVTHDVPPGVTVVGVPARPIQRGRG